MNRDSLQRFLFENEGIRGELVHLSASYTAIMDCHPYPLPVAKLLGKALAAATLLSAPLKYEGSLILQAQSDGAIHLVVAQCNHLLHVRGIAKWKEEKLTEAQSTERSGNQDGELLGNGQLAITIIPKNRKESYQGVINIESHSLASCLESYFIQSEQLPTRIWLTANETCASGLLLQQMPNESATHDNYWEHVSRLAETITADELSSLSNEEILTRLFHQEKIRLFDENPVCFRCSCTIEKMEKAIITLGKSDVDALFTTHKTVDVTCEFCNRHYEFDKVDVEKIFRGL